jgi:hypothetical protein
MELALDKTMDLPICYSIELIKYTSEKECNLFNWINIGSFLFTYNL